MLLLRVVKQAWSCSCEGLFHNQAAHPRVD